MLTLGKAHPLPGLSRVGTFEYTGARVACSLAIFLTGAHPNGFAVTTNRDCPNTECALVVKKRGPGLTIVIGSPKPTGRESYVQFARVA